MSAVSEDYLLTNNRLKSELSHSYDPHGLIYLAAPCGLKEEPKNKIRIGL